MRTVLARSNRRHRAALPAWSLALLLCLLTACTTPPRLATSADDLQGSAYASTNIAVRNAGGSMLHWTFHSDNPHVVLLNQFGSTVTGGALAPGHSAALHIAVLGRVVDPVVGLNATLHFESNGGSRQVLFSAGATGSCSAQPASARTSNYGSGGHSQPVPVGSEILVSYRLPGTGPTLGTNSTGAGSTGADAAGAELSTYQLAYQARAALSSEHGLRTLEAANGAGPDVLAAPHGTDVDALVARLATDPRVAAVQRNYYVELQWNGGAPSDPFYEAQWNLSEFGVPEAWAALTQAPQRDVVLAVLDSGVDSHHPDLAAKMLPGFDFFRNSPTTDPPLLTADAADFGTVSHGTHVAGIAAAIGDEVGVIGVAFGPSVRILPVKLFDDCGERGRLDTLVKAIRWASGLPVAGAPLNENRADIINMSLGVAGRHPVLDQATSEAWRAGVLLVAAAGNNSAGVLSPGNGADVLAVGSVDHDRVRSAFSNFGAGLDVMAPGGYGTTGSSAEVMCAPTSDSTTVLSTVPHLPGAPAERNYACFAGTSMAAPFVAGVAALLLTQDATLTAQDVKQALVATARLEPHMNAAEYGAGIVCADAALGASTQCGAP